MAEAHFFHTGSRRSLPDFHQVAKKKGGRKSSRLFGRICDGVSRVARNGAALF
jgi:hypothetical protein